jgi:UDP-3-O-[3-hydroxymyristoyl] glucosamine N-acyltransferase
MEHLGHHYSLIGQESIQVRNLAAIDTATSDDLSFCSSDDKQGLESVLNSKSGIIICKKTLANSIHENFRVNNRVPKLFVFVDNPRLVFIRIAKVMKDYKDNRKGISNHAIVADSAIIGRDSYIGDFVSIGDNCIVGNNTIVDSGVVVKNAHIGNNCIIQSGNIIGEEGFAFERDENDMKLERFPHFGKVIVKDDVEIFTNCSISRGSLSDTIIEEGTKIDSLCHIAHNVQIGKNTQVTAGTVIGGSTRIGNNCWIGLNSTIKHKLKIGDNVIIGSGSSVIHNVVDKDIVAGSPAKTIRNKITISKDKLFLMGGYDHKNVDKEENHANPKKPFYKLKGFMFIGLLSGIPIPPI